MAKPLRKYRFQPPGLMPSLLMLSMLVLLLQLGYWQADRASQKQALLEDYQNAGSNAHTPALTDLSLEQMRLAQYLPVRVRGRFEQGVRVLLDNRSHGGRLGFHALGIVKLDRTFGSDANAPRHVLVNLGWVPLDGSRDVLPRVDVPAGVVEFGVKLKPIERTWFHLGGLDIRENGTILMPTLEQDLLEEWLGYRVLPVMGLLGPKEDFGYVRQWRAYHGIPPVRHRAYAFQWFSLAATLVVIFLVVSIKKNKSNQSPEEGVDGEQHG